VLALTIRALRNSRDTELPAGADHARRGVTWHGRSRGDRRSSGSATPRDVISIHRGCCTTQPRTTARPARARSQPPGPELAGALSGPARPPLHTLTGLLPQPCRFACRPHGVAHAVRSARVATAYGVHEVSRTPGDEDHDSRLETRARIEDHWKASELGDIDTEHAIYGRTQDGATDASTAYWSGSAIRSPRQRCGTS
jgi:hypothetical protein